MECKYKIKRENFNGEWLYVIYKRKFLNIWTQVCIDSNKTIYDGTPIAASFPENKIEVATFKTVEEAEECIKNLSFERIV